MRDTLPPSVDEDDTSEPYASVAHIAREYCPRLRVGADYRLVRAETSESFGDGIAVFEGAALRWRFTRDRGYLTADVAASESTAPGGWTAWVQFLNLLHALGDEAAVAQLFASGQQGKKGYRALGRLIESRHEAVASALAPSERPGTLARAAAAQRAYLQRFHE